MQPGPTRLTHLDVAIGIKKDVFQLQVSVNNPILLGERK